MAEQPKSAPEQLALSLDADAARPPVRQALAGKVVGFVDAATLAVRREALERVRNSGIFAVPGGAEGANK